MGRYRDNDEGQGLFKDNTGPIPDDMIYTDEFNDELALDGGASDPPKARVIRRGSCRKWGTGVCCLVLVVVVVIAALNFVLGGENDGTTKNDSNEDVTNTVAPIPEVPVTPAPVPVPATPSAPSFPTYTPTASPGPTITAMPTRPLYWTQIGNGLRDSVFDAELMGSALDCSADGSVVWFGAFNYTAIGVPPGVGRLRRLDLDSGEVLEVYGANEKDSLGYQVSGSADGEFVAGFASSNGTLTIWDYLTQMGRLRPYATTTLPSTWDYFSVIYDLSKDGKWLAVTGTELHEGEPGVTDRIEWKLRIYEVVTGAGGNLEPYGPYITIEASLTVQPELLAMDITDDGTVISVGVVGVEGSRGRVHVFQRQADESYSLMASPSGQNLLTSSISDPGINDFYARRIQVRNVEGTTWLFIGWESQNKILIRRWDGSAWLDAGEISAGPEFGDISEFGYDLDLNAAANRMVVGVRCFNDCQGATQVFHINAQGIWEPLGQILVGYEATFFGEAVTMSADGNTIAIGAPEECNDDGICGGAVYIYSYDGPESPVDGLPNTPAASPSAIPVPSTDMPTVTAMPTFAFGWTQVNGIFDSIDEELFAASVSLSGDGTVLYVGAFENGQFAPESGRIVRIDLANQNSELAFYGDAYDFLGFDVSSNNEGNRVVGYLSSSSLLEVADYTQANGLQRSSQLFTNFNSTSATFSLSADGQWLAGIGVIDDAVSGASVLTIKTFQLSEGSFAPFGPDLVFEEMDVAPNLDVHLIEDGSVLTFSVAGWNGYVGEVRTYKRTGTGWVPLGGTLTSDLQDDFYGKTVRLARNPDNVILLFIGAPYRGQVFVYQILEDGSEWEPYGATIEAGLEFTETDEFGFDIDTAHDGSRVVVGVRCYSACRGAVQIFEYTAGPGWQPLGQIIAGFADSYFGEAVDCDADCNVIAVGAPEDCGDDGCGGSVYVFEGVDNRIST